MTQEAWQLQTFKRSIKKKEKLNLIQKNLDVDSDMIVLDLGCAQGILSFFLRQKGGFWVHTDQDFENLKTTQGLLKKNLIQVGTGILPFKSQAFDLVISLDYLEHLEDDEQCLEEISRILKKNGQLVLATPRTGKFLALNKLRPMLGLKLEFYGHKREGYSFKELQKMLNRVHLKVVKQKNFSRFFSEFLELLLNLFYIKFLSRKVQGQGRLRDGRIRPSSYQEFKSQKKSFKIYSFFYPILWLFSRLDKILFFQKGYSLIVWARKIL
jgi:2-polyprenyl-3-methyl-5-hydroxy-6-metoxy-1,4-benzoquinol methylase